MTGCYVKSNDESSLPAIAIFFTSFQRRAFCNVVPHYTANSKKVVLRKSKIQITKYKIQQKVCHITNMNGS